MLGRTQPLVSVVCPTLLPPDEYLNRLENLIADSLKNQKSIENFYSAGHFEIVFVLPRSLNWQLEQKKYLISNVMDEKVGIYNALNLGIQEAAGKFIIVLNSDDWIDLTKVVSVLDRYENKKRIAVYGDTYLCESMSTKFHIAGTISGNTISLARMPGSHQSQLIAKDVYEQLGYFKENLKIGWFTFHLKYANDFEFYCRTIKSGITWRYESDILAYQMMGGATSKHWFRTSIEIYLISLKYSPINLKLIIHLLSSFAGAINFHILRKWKKDREGSSQ